MIRLNFIFVFLLSLSCVCFSQNKTILQAKGLLSNVEVIRDNWGVNHIYANNQHDLFFTQGYCAAKDRLFQFEIWRRQATGTVAEIMGANELKRDIGTRLFKFRGDMQKELAHYHPQGASIIQAYVDGVNAYVLETRKDASLLPVEFRLLKITPQLWTPEVVISRHQGLLGNMPDELQYARAIARVGAEKVKQLKWFHPKDPNLELDSAIDTSSLQHDVLGLYNAYRKELVFDQLLSKTDEDQDAVYYRKEIPTLPFETFKEPEPQGSNNWIVSGKRSTSGYPMLANDPHRKIAVPSLRYIVHLVAPGWNVIGGGEPEIPGVSIGHNEYGTWGLTIFETDGEDLYSYDLDPTDLTRYKYKGVWVKMKEIHETIKIKGAQDQEALLRYTIHGPVTYIDTMHKKAYAVRCAWLEPGGAPYLSSLRIDQATNWDDFRNACSYGNIPGENMIWADRKGNIGWQAVGIIPVRKNFSGLVPVPGDGRFEWDGFLPIKERPHLLNPSNGFFSTANQHVTPSDYTRWDAIGYTWADPYRGNRINEVLASDNKMSADKMKLLQNDYTSLPARTLVPILLTLNFNDSIIQRAKNSLSGWNHSLQKNSIAASIYVMWERQIMLNAIKQFVPDQIKSFITLQTYTVLDWMQHPEKIFKQNPTVQRDAFLRDAFEQAVLNIQLKLGKDMNSWQYGQDKFKHVLLEHPLSTGVKDAMKTKLNVGPAPRGGNGSTPGSTGGADNQVSGASFRMIVDTEDWDKTWMINTPGQSGDPGSRFYRNLFPLWANDEYFPAYYSKDKILKVAAERVVLTKK